LTLDCGKNWWLRAKKDNWVEKGPRSDIRKEGEKDEKKELFRSKKVDLNRMEVCDRFNMRDRGWGIAITDNMENQQKELTVKKGSNEKGIDGIRKESKVKRIERFEWRLGLHLVSGGIQAFREMGRKKGMIRNKRGCWKGARMEPFLKESE